MLTNHQKYQLYKKRTISCLKKIFSKQTWKEFFLPENPKEHYRLLRFLVLTCSVALVIMGLIFIISFSIVRLGKPTVRVPSVEDLDLIEAINIIQSEKLIAHIETRFSKNHRRYRIIKQHPSRGTMTREGRSITLVVSMGIDEYKVPQLEGLARDIAIDILEKNHIPYIIQTISIENQENDTVGALSIATGTKVSREIPLTVSIIDNSKKNIYKMDNFVNQPLEFAANVLHTHRISPILITSNVNFIAEDGIVLEQNTPENTILPQNTSVLLTIGLKARDAGEKEKLRWQYFSYHFPRMNIQEVTTITNSEGEISYITPEAPTAKHYKVILEDELGRSNTIYEKTGAEGTSFIQVFKAYGQAKVYIYADNEIIASKDYATQ